MPDRLLAATKLSEFFGVIAHPRRIQIVEELRAGESDVSSLTASLGISASNVSQHLSLLRAHRIVEERREGRHIIYRLRCKSLAKWLLDAMRFLPVASDDNEAVRAALQGAKKTWEQSVHSKRVSTKTK